MANVRQKPVYMLYRIYDADGDLLYIGMAKNAISRLSDHMKSSAWKDKACTVKVERVDGRHEAIKAERDAIRAERPLRNVIHNPPPPKIVAAPGVLTSYINATGMSREAIAKRAGISRQTLHSVEYGRSMPRFEQAARIAAAIGCHVIAIRPDLEGIIS